MRFFISIFPLLVQCLFIPISYSNSLDESQLSCLLEPSLQIELSSSVPGVVHEMNIERGDYIERGNKIIELNSTVQKAALFTAQAREKFAARKLARNKNLLDQNLLSESEEDELITEHQLALLLLDEAKAQVAQRSIMSPVDGVVVKRNVSVGEYVGSEPIAKLVSLDPLYAEVVMRADVYREFDSAMKVTLTTVYGEQLHPGKIIIVDKVIDAASGTFGIRIEVPNPDSILPAGIKCQAHFEKYPN